MSAGVFIPHDLTFVPWLDALTGAALGPGENAVADLVLELAQVGREHGLTLEVCHDLGLYAQLHAADPRLSFSPSVNPAYNPATSPADTAIMVLRRGQVVVGVYGMGVRWISGTLRERIDDMTVICQRPDLLPPGDSWHCTADIADAIANCTVGLGMSIWTDQTAGAHERVISALLSRMMILYFYMQACAGWFVGFATKVVARSLTFGTYGAEGMQDGVTFTHAGRTVPTLFVYAARARYRRQLMRSTFLDLSMPLSALPPERAA